MEASVRPGHYVRFNRRTPDWPYIEEAFAIVTGNPKHGIRIRALDTHRTHVLVLSSVTLSNFHEAHA